MTTCNEVKKDHIPHHACNYLANFGIIQYIRVYSIKQNDMHDGDFVQKSSVYFS